MERGVTWWAAQATQQQAEMIRQEMNFDQGVKDALECGWYTQEQGNRGTEHIFF